MTTRTRELIALGENLVIGSSANDAYLASMGDEVDDPALSFLGQIVPADAIVADVGANIGLHALALARRAPKGHIYAFEPVPATASHLAENVVRNGATNVSCHVYALGSAPGSLTLFENADFPAGATVVDHATPLARDGMSKDAGSFVKVQTKTLDNVVDELAVARLDILKIDAEGHDLDVLRGATNTLSRFRPVVVMEFATFALTGHRQLLPVDVLDEVRRTFDQLFVVERKGEIREMRTDRDAWDFLWENATTYPVQDLVGVFGESRLIGVIDDLAAERERTGPAPPEPTATEVALDAERARNAELSTELASARELIDQLREVESERVDEIVRLSHEVSRLEDEIAAMRRTVSWRITRPLRAIRRLLPPR